MIDKKTSYLSLPLPDLSNMQDEDVPRIGLALRILDAHAQDVDAHAQSVDASLQTQGSDVQALTGSNVAQAGRLDVLEQAQEKEAVDRAAADRGAAIRIDALSDEQAAVALRVDALDESSAEHGDRLSSVEGDVTAISTMLIGTVFPHTCADSYVPNGCVPANGGEYTRAQFPALYDTYLAGGRLLTCTYTAWAAQVAITGNCGKFALDADDQKFKVPLLKDGDSITQASSAAELGKSVKAGLPNLTGTFESPQAITGSITGVFSRQSVTKWYVMDGSNKPFFITNFDASQGGTDPIYGKSTTVTDEQVRLRHFVVLASAQNSASVFDWSNYMAALAGKANVDLSNATGNAIGLYLYARDEKASGTQGGTSAAAAWQTRDLNTVKVNNLGGASLANNRVTLPAGRYYVRGKAPAYAASNTRCAIYDATNAAYLLHGNSMTANQSYYGYVCPEVEGAFTLTAQTTIELRMYTGGAISSYGLGFAVGVANINEVFSELRIWKM